MGGEYRCEMWTRGSRGRVWDRTEYVRAVGKPVLVWLDSDSPMMRTFDEEDVFF